MTDPSPQELHPRITQRPGSGVSFAGTGGLYTAARSDHNHLSMDVDWVAFPYNTNWTDWGSTFQVVQYGIDSAGWVVLRGLGKWTGGGAPTGGAVIGNLPTEFRPPADLVFASFMSAGAGRLDVKSNGDLAYLSGISATNSYFTVNSIRFRNS